MVWKELYGYLIDNTVAFETAIEYDTSTGSADPELLQHSHESRESIERGEEDVYFPQTGEAALTWLEAISMPTKAFFMVYISGGNLDESDGFSRKNSASFITWSRWLQSWARLGLAHGELRPQKLLVGRL